MPTRRLNGRGPLPLHRQLKDALRRDILRRYRPGEQIPSEREICRDYGVSRTTVRHTVTQLVYEGRLLRVPAKGTFVAVPKIQQDLARVMRFSETVAAIGRTPRIRVLSTAEITAPAAAAHALELSDGERVTRIDVLGLADDQPLVLYRVHLRADNGAAVAAALLTAQHRGAATLSMILEEIRERTGLAPAWAVQSYEAGLVREPAAGLLGLHPGGAVFVSSRTIYAGEGVPIEYDEVVYRGDQYQFTIRRAYS